MRPSPAFLAISKCDEGGQLTPRCRLSPIGFNKISESPGACIGGCRDPHAILNRGKTCLHEIARQIRDCYVIVLKSSIVEMSSGYQIHSYCIFSSP